MSDLPRYKRLVDSLGGLGGTIPMHMPGHKRNVRLADYLKTLGAENDITEIDGFDDLYDAHGLLSDGMARTAELYSADRSFFLVNGTTGGILSAVRTLAGDGGCAVMARNCHKSVYNAFELCRLRAEYILPSPIDGCGIYGGISPESVCASLESCPKAKFLIITSPTYEGVVSDVKAVCDIAHSRGVPVIVDEAHGAHLDLSPYFTGGAVKAGADIVIQSVHKTLPSLTQTAVAHCREKYASGFARQLSVFQTSSPSYLLMASIDACCEMLLSHGDELFRDWSRLLDTFYTGTKRLRRLSVLDDIANRDRSKIVISTVGTTTTGPLLMHELRLRSIELEMAQTRYALAMTGPGDTAESMGALLSALLEIDGCISRAGDCADAKLPPLPEISMPAFEAAFAECEEVPCAKATERVSAEYVMAYPPGIPLLVPGEVISQELICSMLEMAESGINLRSSGGGVPEKFAVLKKTL